MAKSTGTVNLTVNLSGWNELVGALDGLGRRAARRVGGKAMKKAAEVIANEARVHVPVDTGELEDSITTLNKASGVRDTLSSVVGFKKPTSSRAHFVEFGTVKMAAQPFMRPALDAKAEDAIAVMCQEMWNGIDAEARKAKK